MCCVIECLLLLEVERVGSFIKLVDDDDDDVMNVRLGFHFVLKV